MLDTVLPSLLPLDIIWLVRPQEGFSGPEIFFEVFLADVDAELVENFDHVVVVYSERAGGAARLNILHIAQILHITDVCHIDERF
jgi:hypothetical protein